MTRSLTMVAMIHYMWLMFGSSVFAAKALSNPDRQLKKNSGITSAWNGLAIKTGPTAGPWNGGTSGSANRLVDNGVSGHYFDDPHIPGCRKNSQTIRC